MDSNVQPGETGQNGETAESQPAQETTQTGETEAAQSSAETQNTETQPNMVPSGRLREEADRRREAERRLEATEAELKQMREAAQPAKPEKVAEKQDPPENLDPRERARWLVRNDAKEWFEEEFGMSVSDVKTLIGTTKVTAEDYATRTWQRGCEQNRIDPENREAAETVRALVKGGLKLEDAFSRAGKLYGKAESAETTGASVETTSQTGAMANERIVPKSAQHARELAEKGVTIGHTSMHELIRGISDAEKERAGANRVRTIQ